MDKKIEERIRVAVVITPIEALAGFCAVNFTFVCDESRRLDHSYWVDLLVEKLDTANIKEREAFIDRFGIDSLRVCTSCGNFMTEGYYLDGDYACSRECAESIYKSCGLSVKDLDDDLKCADDEDCSVYWTEWE